MPNIVRTLPVQLMLRRQASSYRVRIDQQRIRHTHSGILNSAGPLMSTMNSRPVSKANARPLSLGVLMCTILPRCFGLQVMDDGVVPIEDGILQPAFSSGMIGPKDEYRAHSSQGAHIGAEHVQHRRQTLFEHRTWQANVRKHVETTGGAFVGHIPDHVIEHLAES